MIERTFIQKNYNKMELEDYLTRKLDRAGFSHMEIIKTPLVTRIVLHVAKPGMAIGKSGATIKQLTEIIATKYKIDNPQIEIQEIKEPNLDAKVLAGKMVTAIERGFSWRSVAYKTMKDIIDAGAQGVELVIKGKLSGKGGRKRKQRIAHGYLKKVGYQSKYVDKAKAAAYPKAGAIGIRLSIVRPGIIFPDKIDVKKVVESKKNVEREAKEQAEKKAETAKAEETKATEEKEIKVEGKPDEKTEKDIKAIEKRVEEMLEKKLKERGVQIEDIDEGKDQAKHSFAGAAKQEVLQQKAHETKPAHIKATHLAGPKEKTIEAHKVEEKK